MKTNLKAIAVLAAAATLSVAITGCSTATPTDTPGVERAGRYVLKQFGPELWAVLGYRFADTQLGEDWMMLEVALTSPQGQFARVLRDDVFLTNPNGNRIELASQEEFNEAWGQVLRPMIAQANINRDPLEYFPPNREECLIQFFVQPGQGVSFDEVTLNQERGCVGRLYFQVPGGIQPGRWIFGIDLEESEIRIPFELGE
jgi:hypothetical protein